MNIWCKLSSNPEEINNFVTFVEQMEKNLETGAFVVMLNFYGEQGLCCLFCKVCLFMNNFHKSV